MRIGLDFRFLALGRQNAVRGIPRFTQEQLQSVLALDRDSTYLLLCNPADDLGAIRPEIRAAPNAHIVCAPDASSPAFGLGDDGRTLLARYAAYQHWIEGLHLDLYHSTCHFWVSSLILPGFDACPYVVTSYDLIPLLYPAHIPGEWAQSYHRGLLFLEQATRIAAISQATADDLVEHLGVPSDRIDVTLPAISSSFRTLPPEATRSILATLDHPARRFPRHRVRIPSNYLLSVTDLHYTKNLPTLLSAYAELSRRTRSDFPLVIAGHLVKSDVEVLHRRAGSLGIGDELILTGRVSDHELTALYNGATILVNPSHHEGFGLTVAEAMRCGAPVITTTRSALPEVAGDAALLVDSEEKSAFVDAIDTLLRDSELRNDLSRRGRVRAARYTTAALGQATLDCYRNAVSTAKQTASEPIRVALWSPVAPQMSGVSDYADDLVTSLAIEPGLQLDLFVDDDVLPPLEVMRTARVHHWSDFDRCARRAPYDVTMYQDGASPFHVYMDQAMLRHPGIVVLHDLQWSSALLIDRLRRPHGNQRFRTELVAVEGERAARQWDRLRGLPQSARRDAVGAFVDDHPMLGPVVDAATCCVTLTPEAGDDLRRRYPNADVRVIPFGVRDPRQDGIGFDRAIARGFLGLDPRTFVVVAPGPIDAAKHFDSILDSFADLRQTVADVLLAAVGWTPDAEYVSGLRSRAQSLGIDDAFLVTGPVPRTLFDAYLAACDAVVVLRDLRPRQTPTVVARALAAGRCLVVSDVPTMASIPDNACIRVAAPLHERAGVAAALSVLASDPERRHDLEHGARAQYEATARLDGMVDGYVNLIRGQAGPRRPERPVATVSAARTGRAGRPVPPNGPLPYSKVCELEDFAHPQLRDVLREVHPHKRVVFGGDFPRGYEHRMDWEAAMAVRTLSDHGALRPDARLLVVAARSLDISFYMTRHVGEVVAMYCGRVPSERTAAAAEAARLDGQPVAPFEFAEERLTVQHIDRRVVGYPDESFDAIVSSSHADDAGGIQEIAAAAYEMGRVLKPGGVLSLSTDILLSSECGSEPLPAEAVLLSYGELQRFIVEASGLEPIDDLRVSVSHWTLSTARDDVTATADCRARMAAHPDGSRPPEWTCWDMPHIVLERGGRRYTSVHLALRRATS